MPAKHTVLVTGASAGLGKDFAQALVNAGYTVYAAARRLENMNDLKSLGVIPLQMDITNEAAVQAVVQTITAKHGGVDLLINNAGFGLFGTVEETSLKDARYQFDVNLFGLARLTQLLIPYMREQKFGKIINISSVGGKVYGPLGAWYYGSKHALEGWSDCLRLELAPFNVKVVVIEPGYIATDFSKVVMSIVAKHSGGGAYAELINKFNKLRKNLQGSSPSVITDLVLKAVSAQNPKTRYAGGKFARLVFCVRKWLGDRFFDKMIMRMLK